MLKKIPLLIIVFSFFATTHSQNNINDYKYVVVPIQFDFVKGKDRFRINTLTRYLFNENGYTAYLDEQELPEDLFKDRCMAMYADVKKVKGGLKTVIQIELRDCRGDLILTSSIGKTKVKEYDKAYAIAIRQAFESIKLLGYNYQPNTSRTAIEDLTNVQLEKEALDKAEIERLKKEVESLKEKEATAKKAAEMKTEAGAKKIADKKTAEQKEIEKKKEKTEQLIGVAPVKASKIVSDDSLKTKIVEGGFQVIDSDGAILMVLLKTAAPNVYAVKGKDAIVFKQDGKWVYSENTGTSKVEKVLKIKI